MNVWYPKAKELFLQGGIDMAGDNVRAVLIDTDAYTYNAGHGYYSNLTGVVGNPSSPLTNKSFSDGIFDADDAAFAQVSGDTVEALVVYLDTGEPSTSPLLLYIGQATGLPVTPNGGDINIIWDELGISAL